MAKNPISDWLADQTSRRGPAPVSQAEAVANGNAYLAEIGRNDVHWYIHEGQLCIGFKPQRRA